MRDADHRTLDVLSREIGRPLSIRGLAERIRRAYGAAHYASVHRSVRDLAREGVVAAAQCGRSVSPSLDLSSPLAADRMAQVELENKASFLARREDWQEAVGRLTEALGALPGVGSAAMVRPEEHARLNRMELLVVLRQGAGEAAAGARDAARQVGRACNVRVDALALGSGALGRLLCSGEANLAREALSCKTVILRPQEFWMQLARLWREGARIASHGRIDPTEISGADMAHNLNRFGYQEMGTAAPRGTDIGVEYVVTSILVQGTARQVSAIPVMLAKCRRIDYGLLAFMAEKYAVMERLLPYLKILLEARPDDALRGIVGRPGPREEGADADDARRAMRLYNVA